MIFKNKNIIFSLIIFIATFSFGDFAKADYFKRGKDEPEENIPLNPTLADYTRQKSPYNDANTGKPLLRFLKYWLNTNSEIPSSNSLVYTSRFGHRSLLCALANKNRETYICLTNNKVTRDKPDWGYLNTLVYVEPKLDFAILAKSDDPLQVCRSEVITSLVYENSYGSLRSGTREEVEQQGAAAIAKQFYFTYGCNISKNVPYAIVNFKNYSHLTGELKDTRPWDHMYSRKLGTIK